jgi:SAM-dependent methyltransferase
MGLAAEVCFRLARHRLRTRTAADAGGNPATLDEQAYMAWRSRVLSAQLAHDFSIRLAGLDVLDFGCGAGALSFVAARLGARSVIGIDVAPRLIQLAHEALAQEQPPVRPRFMASRCPTTIDLPDASIDAILCFDTLEHIADYRAVMREWRRVLRAGGRVLIWWSPWYHPYGHHIESLVPLPWAHVVFAEPALTRTCARIFDLDEFVPRVWDLDEEGRKKPNKWTDLTELPDVNRLTIRRFERACKPAGLRIEQRRIAGFGGTRAARLTRVLTRVPGLREFFTAHVTYELRPDLTRGGSARSSS